jgi:DNA-binding response OmpR family regulator
MILLVDDDPDFLALAHSALAQHELVYFARTVAQAIILLGYVGGEIDLALVDLDLRRESGFELIREIRLHNADLPVIAMSGVVCETVLESANYLEQPLRCVSHSALSGSR